MNTKIPMMPFDEIEASFNNIQKNVDCRETQHGPTPQQGMGQPFYGIVREPAMKQAGEGNQTHAIETIRDFEKFLRDVGGFTRRQAESIALGGFVETGEAKAKQMLADTIKQLRGK